MKFYYGINPSEKREKLINSEIIKPIIDEIITSADKAIEEEHLAFKMSEFMMYFANGNRSFFERKYFARRRNCSNLFFAYWLIQDEKYLTALIDYIMFICDEFTWCLPAHSDYDTKKPQEVVETIDLFQAETARLFAEIKICLEDKLPAHVFARMEYEIRRRIFPSILKSSSEKYWWESCKTNWATVCGAGTTMAALCFGTEEEQELFVNRFRYCLDDYLEGITEDGCCLEGIVYWNYGVEHFVILAEAIRVYSDGKINYFENPKVKKLALFPQKVRMSETKVASFSDANEKFYIKIGLISFLKNVYDEILLPDIKVGVRRGNVDSLCELLWLDENYQSDKLKKGITYFENSQWYIDCKESYSFASKAGHNNEAHNHNDVGAFIITVGEETFISDLGAGEYVKGTFDSKTRYTFLQNSSRGHSVPIINGMYQSKGDEYRSTNVSVTENTFEMDIAKTYPEGIVGSIKRKFELYDEKIILTDAFERSELTETIVERFITKLEPTICDGYVDCGVGKIIYDKDKYIPAINTEIFTKKGQETVYLIDFKAISDDENVFTFEFVM